MTPPEYQAIRARAAAATPGPWEALEVEGDLYQLFPKDADEPWVGDISDQSDAAFIAAARTDVPRLLAEVGRLRDLVTSVAEMAEHAVLVVHGPRSIEAENIRKLLAGVRK